MTNKWIKNKWIIEITNEEWMIKMNEWPNKRMKEKNGWMSKKINEFNNKWMDEEKMNEWTNKWMNKQTNGKEQANE